MVKYSILGPVELCHGERWVAVGGPRQSALLALLLINANRALSRDRLIDALWGSLGPPGAVKRLHVAIARLRRSLDGEGVRGESVLRTVAGGYVLVVRPGELDAEVFETRVEEGRRALESGATERARDVLGEALAIWRGSALATVAYAEFAQPEIRRLEELRLSALEARVDAELRLGEHTGVIGELEGLVAAYPGRERLAAQLMLALYRCGRQGEALEVYARARAYLSGELGLEPGLALRGLQAEILAQSPALQRVPDEPGRVTVADPPAPARADALPTGVVTFLLTDVEGSTRLWDADADAMAAALEFHDALIGTLVGRRGGRLLKEKGEGDATLSVFQRASDAVACAAELQRALATASWPSRLDLRVRIALHSGEAQEREGDYFGPALNRAARLRSLAAGGVTVLSQTTVELVRDRLPQELQLVDVGRHELRGLSRAERVFELRAMAGSSAGGTGAVPGPVMLALPRSLHAPESFPFVGRDAELERLRERWRQVCGGERAAVVIGGEAGIGKTRLATELARAVHEQGALVLYGRCDEGLAVPYQPFVEALRPYARAAGLDRLRAELGNLAPELGRLLPELVGLGAPISADPESERFALFEAVTALIEAATRERRVLLVLDDLHWATTPTLLLLRHLIRSERPLGALLVSTYRETELDLGQPLAQLLADLHRDESVELLSVRGLGEQAIAELLEAAVGHALDEHASTLVRVLGAQTAGNPFFVRELLAHVVESGERLGTGVTAMQFEAPVGLRHVIVQRVARLSAPAVSALSVAAVAGATFSFVLLEHVLGERADVLDALDEGVAAGLLTEAGHGEYVFAHALVRQTIYGQLGSARRMRLHRQLGEALEALGDADAQVDALAYHFAQAAADAQGVKAAAYALAAGRRAVARLGYEEAAAHYRRGLDALMLTGQPQDEWRCQLLLALGEAGWGAGELDNARQAYARAADLADRLDDATSLAHAALGFCGPYRAELAPAVTRPVAGLLERALAALDKNDSALRARLMGRLASVLAYTGVAQRRPALARHALEMARRVADEATLADVLASALWATRGPDTLPESMAMAAELGRVADEVGDRGLRALAHAWLLDYRLELGDIDTVEHELEALQRLARTRRERYFTWILMVRQGSHAHLQGRLEECETLAQQALAQRFEGQDELAAHIFGVQMLFLRREQGRLDDLVQPAESFAEQYPQLSSWRCALASIHAGLGRTAQARRDLEALAHADFSDIPRDGFWLSNLSTLSEVVVLLGDAPRAQSLYTLLLPYADRCAASFALLCQGSVARPLGLLATAMSRFDDAALHFEHALAMNAQIRSPLWIGHTQHDYARMLLLRNHSGDRDKALELLNDALATAKELGLPALADKARRTMLTAEGIGPSTALRRPV
jgi:DNA-binding SARP family transcriptional activator/Mrp family chromosome partitioning ATPase